MANNDCAKKKLDTGLCHAAKVPAIAVKISNVLKFQTYLRTFLLSFTCLKPLILNIIAKSLNIPRYLKKNEHVLKQKDIYSLYDSSELKVKYISH